MAGKKKVPDVVAGEVNQKEDTAEMIPRRSRVLYNVLSALVIVGSLGAVAYFHLENQKLKEARTLPEAEALVAEISAFFELPSDETPTVATVTDREKLSVSAFFDRAQNGDKVLIYNEAKRAVLYRPSVKKIINVAPLGDSVPEPAASPESSPVLAGDETSVSAVSDEKGTPVSGSASAETAVVKTSLDEEEILSIGATVALYNGSTKVGVTNTLEKEIQKKFSNVEIVAKEKAANNDYQGNVVVSFVDSKDVLAEKLAKSVGGSVGELPAGERVPQADILVIVGNAIAPPVDGAQKAVSE